MPLQEPRKTLEEIVSEVGQYPMDAFIFVQECVGVAAEHVHGAMTPEQTAVAHWMAKHEITPEVLREMEQARRLPPDIATALRQMGGAEAMNRHVTGGQLCLAVRDTALHRWGLLARVVLSRWNIRRTEDIGAIIFALVENGWLQKQPTDTIGDFDHVFSFDEAFEKAYQIGAR